MRLAKVFALSALLVAGCGGGNGTNSDGGAGGSGRNRGDIPDGFLQQNCQTPSDCDDNDPCTDDVCSNVTRQCQHQPIDCSAMADACNTGMCMNGACMAVAANEMMGCTDANGNPGACSIGFCKALPQCSVSYSNLTCSSTGNHQTSTTKGNTAVIDTYACATGESGPEMAYPFSVFTDRMVTITLSGTTADLDLIVLEGGACVRTAACTAFSTTLGTGNEKVTFMAKGGQMYTVVVDGKAGAKSDFTLDVSCVGGTCKSIKPLACNMTLSGTVGGAQSTSVVSSSCGTMDPGPEDTYSLTPAMDQQFHLKLSGLQTDLDLSVVYESQGECNPTSCKASNVQTGTTDENVSFEGFSTSTYDVIVDSKTAAGGAYQLEVDCPPSCYNSNNSTSCDSPADLRRNDDATRSTKIIDTWSCAGATGETGPEVVYTFSPNTSGPYTFTLSGLTADLDLMVMEGHYAACDPTGTCTASSIHAGTGDETVTFMADSSKYYYVAVDGRAGAVSSYQLKMTSTVCPPPDCSNSSNSFGCSWLEDARRNDDPNRSKLAVDTWSCTGATGETGPEVVYTFSPDVSGSYTVTLDNLSANLDLIVMQGKTAYTCDPTAMCAGASLNTGTTAESVVFTADSTKTYYVAVDGKNGAVGTYHLKIASSSCPAPVCKDSIEDIDCTNKSRSVNSDEPYWSTSDVSMWGCAGATGLTGAEHAHHFTPTASGSYTFQMIGLRADLDLLVVEATATGGCSPTAACVAASTSSGTTSESVTFTADKAKSYFIIADGKNGAVSPYTLAVTAGCP